MRQRERLRQLVIEAEIQRFSRPETHSYINAKLGGEFHVSIEYLDKVKNSVKRGAIARMSRLRKSRHAFLDQYFQRIDEVLKYQQEQWRLYHLHRDKPLIQKLCLQELHALTVTLANLYDALPAISEIAGQISNEADLPEHKTLVSGPPE